MGRPQHGPLDDAAVVRISGGGGLVLTVDVITPIVDDPRDVRRDRRGQLDQRRLRDGRRPQVALNVVGFPRDKLPLEC